MKRAGDKWFVVDLQGLYIDSGHKDIASANERAVAFKREGGQPKVMTKPRVGSLELPADDPSSWSPKRKNPTGKRKNPNGELNALEADLSPEEYQAFSDMVLPLYTVAAFPRATAAEARLALAFREAVREKEGDFGWRAVKAVPSEHVHEGTPGRLMLIFEDVADTADRVMFSHRWQVMEKRVGAYLESYNGWSASVIAPRANPPLEDHVEYEPKRTVRALRSRYGREAVEGMLRENPRLNPDGGHDTAKGEDIFQMWHQKEPSKAEVRPLGCDWNEKLVCVGKAHNIVYRSGKWEKGRKTNDYIHHFDSKPSVYMRAGVVEGGTGGKTVEQLMGRTLNADGRFLVAELASVLSFALDDGGDGEDMVLHNGAKVYGCTDKRTVLILDPVWGPIVIKGGKMHFDERGIVL